MARVLRVTWIAAVAFFGIGDALQSHVYAQVTEKDNTQVEEIPFTPAEKALELFSTPAGFKKTLFAAEPDIHQPIAMTTDAKGRLWVVECYTYSDRKTNYDMTKRDRVVIFEDKDNDGVFDERKVFWDQGTKLTGIELGYGGVWLTAAPSFIFVPDADGDDTPDGPPQVLLDGFEDDSIRHNIVNGLRWGPDGWLYSRHGIQATSFVGKPGASKSRRIAMNCCIWRYHPIQKIFEVVAQGGTNPWGFDYDEHGEMFMINTVIGHLFHVVPGARYRRMYGSHFNPYTYQIIEQTADHYHWDQGEEHWAAAKKTGLSSGTDAAGGGHAHTGLMIYQGGNWPQQYHNGLFTANFHGRRINHDSIERVGNSYVARHEPDFAKSGDPWFRGVELIYGPDGGVFVLDWSDIGECHENDGIHRTSGRIFKFLYGEPSQQPVDLNAKADQELVAELYRDNAWYARIAQRLLSQRANSGTLKDTTSLFKQLEKDLFSDKSTVFRLRCLWTLYSCGGASENVLLRASHLDDEHLRAWSVRLFSDGLKAPTAKVMGRLEEMASDSSGLVRLYVASSLSRMPHEQRIQVATKLVTHSGDADDRVQPHLIWFGVEPSLMVRSDSALQLAENSQMPLVSQNIVRRLTESIEENPKVVDSILALIRNKRLDPQNTLEGMALALNGWGNVKPPKSWAATVSSIKTEGQSRSKSFEALQRLELIFGNQSAVQDLKKTALSGSVSIPARRKAIVGWAKTKPDDLAMTLKDLIRDRSLTTAVVKAAVYCDEADMARAILNQMRHMDPEGKAASVNTLISREPWAKRLLTAVKNGRVSKDLISAYHAGIIRNFESSSLDQLLAETWGVIRETPEEKSKEIEALRRELLTSANEFVSHDAWKGRLLFEKNCAQCHMLYGKGGNTGPDLTGSDRKNLNYLLENIVSPSSSVAETYKSSVISLEDGRLINGLILKRNSKVLQVQTPEEVLNLDAESVEGIRTSEKSVMPEGLLNNLSKQQKADLFGYLLSPTQVAEPAKN